MISVDQRESGHSAPGHIRQLYPPKLSEVEVFAEGFDRDFVLTELTAAEHKDFAFVVGLDMSVPDLIHKWKIYNLIADGVPNLYPLADVV